MGFIKMEQLVPNVNYHVSNVLHKQHVRQVVSMDISYLGRLVQLVLTIV